MGHARKSLKTNDLLNQHRNPHFRPDGAKKDPTEETTRRVSSKSLYLMINYIVINLQLHSFTKQRYTHYTVYKCTATCLRNVIFVEAPGAFLKVYFCHTVFTALRAKSTGTWQDRHKSFHGVPSSYGLRKGLHVQWSSMLLVYFSF